MIHRAAMVQLLDFDRDGSAQVNLIRLAKDVGSVREVARRLEANFDGLVITMSNIFRAGATEESIAEILKELNIPIYCVGAGLQDELPPGDASMIDDTIMNMMRVIDEKGVLLGVRGPFTQRWMESVGFKNAKAIGCPSMFAYPRNIVSIKPPKKVSKVMTAGHLQFSAKQLDRSLKLMNAFEGVKCSYVFQGETRGYRELLDRPNLFNEATQQVRAAVMKKYITEKSGKVPPFSAYYSFTEVAAWRQACINHDVYAGDRIHGGVAALQAGVPALILFADLRVSELSTYHGIPSCSLDEFAELGCRAAIEKYLNAERIQTFQDHYRGVQAAFVKTVEEAGLTVSASSKL